MRPSVIFSNEAKLVAAQYKHENQSLSFMPAIDRMIAWINRPTAALIEFNLQFLAIRSASSFSAFFPAIMKLMLPTPAHKRIHNNHHGCQRRCDAAH